MRLPKESPWSSQRAKGYQMRQVIETHLPHLTQSQLTGLAWWVCGTILAGTILAGSACQNAVASALSTRGNWNNLRQYLREWLYDGGDRARPCKNRTGRKSLLRAAAPVGPCVVAFRPAGAGG